MSASIVRLSHTELALIEVVGKLIGTIAAQDPQLAEKLRDSLVPLQNKYNAGQDRGRDDAGLTVIQHIERVAPALVHHDDE